ncbi:DUF3570 domain-containing protein [Noviherbaspirillum galbum]|uniref:DUF3570 domain-containing protein n=1 Tax=Noviherbaspirillum galbum TaxID=2709383 RepID=UPI001F41AFB6|nr:DUF3570 domain-containing protein [Noviherbaspirillum galbum]
MTPTSAAWPLREQAPDKTEDACAPAAGFSGSALLMAALALPGMIGAAHAESAPERGQVELNYLDYRDRQPGLDRVNVHTPSIRVLAPIAGMWAIEGSLTSDSISGATPRYHSAISGASTMSDRRTAQAFSVTRYFPDSTVSAGFAHSGENDYQSRAYSLDLTRSTEDKNTVFNAGIGVANDVINPVNGLVTDAKKHVLELKAGITRVLTQRDLIQADISHVVQHGYLNDPYKVFDKRPDSRSANILLLRWNHHLDADDGTSRLGYRYYSDSFGIRAHTLSAEYVQPLPSDWTLTPSLRLYSQTAASFYVGPVYSPVLGEPVPAGYDPSGGANVSEDYRLSAFGAATLAMKVEKRIGRDASVRMQLGFYEQRSGWALSGNGGPGLATLRAQMISVGITRQF